MREKWRLDYNKVRSHKEIGYMLAVNFVERYTDEELLSSPTSGNHLKLQPSG